MEKFKIFFCIFVVVLQCACNGKGSEDVKAIFHAGEYNASLQAWGEMKSQKDSYYKYTRNFRSWVGSGSSTQIYVNNNVVVKREYLGYDSDEVTTEEWTEENTELGNHAIGAALLTIDEIYERCKKEILSESDSNYKVYYSTNESGLISSCTKIHQYCADDCSIGFGVSDFQFL
jgi:hypothetical protein